MQRITRFLRIKSINSNKIPCQTLKIKKYKGIMKDIVRLLET